MFRIIKVAIIIGLLLILLPATFVLLARFSPSTIARISPKISVHSTSVQSNPEKSQYQFEIKTMIDNVPSRLLKQFWVRVEPDEPITHLSGQLNADFHDGVAIHNLTFSQPVVSVRVSINGIGVAKLLLTAPVESSAASTLTIDAKYGIAYTLRQGSRVLSAPKDIPLNLKGDYTLSMATTGTQQTYPVVHEVLKQQEILLVAIPRYGADETAVVVLHGQAKRDGRALTLAEVRIRSDQRDDRFSSAKLKTDRHGSFRTTLYAQKTGARKLMLDISGKRHQVELKIPEFSPSTTRTTTDLQKLHIMSVPDAATISLDGIEQSSVTPVSIPLRREEDKSLIYNEFTTDGKRRRVSVSVSKQGYHPIKEFLEIGKDQSVFRAYSLRPVNLSGRVATSKDSSMIGVKLILADGAEELKTTMTDESGKFIFNNWTNINPGKYSLMITDVLNRFPDRRIPLDLTLKDDLDLGTITINPKVAVHVRVIDALTRKAPVNRPIVLIEKHRAKNHGKVYTLHVDGSNAVPLEVNATGYQSYRETLLLDAEPLVLLTVPLMPLLSYVEMSDIDNEDVLLADPTIDYTATFEGKPQPYFRNGLLFFFPYRNEDDWVLLKASQADRKISSWSVKLKTFQSLTIK